MKIRLGLVLLATAALSACGPSPDALFADAQESFAAQDYQAARRAIISALDKQPADPAMLALLVRTQIRLADPDGAESALGRLERAGGKADDLVRLRADIALLRQQPQQALTLLGDDASPEGWRIRAEAHAALGNATAAKAAYEKGMATGGAIELAASYGRFALTQGDTVLASRILARMQSIAPKAYETGVMAGDLAVATGRIDTAIGAYRAVIAAYPDRVAPMLALANQLDAKGKVAEAQAVVDQAGQLAPQDKDVENLKYQLLAEKGEWEKIRTGLQGREAELDPSSGLGMKYAEALLRLGYAEQARILFKRAALLLPGNPYSRMMLGEAQLASGDPQDAWDTLRPLAMSTLARPEVLERAHKAAQAVGAPEAEGLALRLEPARMKVTARLLERGDIAVMRQDWPTVLAVNTQLLKQGDDPEVLKRLALATSGMGRTGEAIGYADRALGLAPDSADFLYLAGLVRLQGGQDIARSRALLEAAAQADPRNPVIARDLAKAKAAAG